MSCKARSRCRCFVLEHIGEPDRFFGIDHHANAMVVMWASGNGSVNSSWFAEVTHYPHITYLMPSCCSCHLHVYGFNAFTFTFLFKILLGALACPCQHWCRDKALLLLAANMYISRTCSHLSLQTQKVNQVTCQFDASHIWGHTRPFCVWHAWKMQEWISHLQQAIYQSHGGLTDLLQYIYIQGIRLCTWITVQSKESKLALLILKSYLISTYPI